MRRPLRRRLVDATLIPLCLVFFLGLVVLHEVHEQWGER